MKKRAPRTMSQTVASVRNSVLKLAPNLTLADYFTPVERAYLNAPRLIEFTGTVILPDQEGPIPLIHSQRQQGQSLRSQSCQVWECCIGTTVRFIQEVRSRNDRQQRRAVRVSAYWNHTLYFAPALIRSGFSVGGGCSALR